MNVSNQNELNTDLDRVKQIEMQSSSRALVCQTEKKGKGQLKEDMGYREN
jgi:hypothetical protein